MSIETRIQAINDHLVDDYKVLRLAGADLTGVDKNIVNLKMSWKERLLYFMNNGTDEVWNNWDKVNGTGTTLSLNNTEEAPMSLTYKGNTSQSGTPTPTSPIPVQVVSGDNSINILNKNLVNTNVEKKSSYPTTTIGSVVSYVNSSASSSYVNCCYLEAGTTYTFSCKLNTPASTTYRDSVIVDKNNIVLEHFYLWNNSTHNTYTPTHSGYLILCVDNNSAELMIEKGNQATTYEAYKGASYPISLGDKELCKIGTYQDKIDKSSGKNLLNRATCEEGKALVWTTGVTFNDTGSLTTDFIKVEPQDTIYCTYNCQKMFYDENKNYLGCLQANGTISTNSNGNISNSFTIPNVSNICYVKFGYRQTYNQSVDLLNANIMVNKGDTLLEYEPYGTGWYLKKEIGKVVLNGTETGWSNLSMGANYKRTDVLLPYTPMNTGTRVYCLSNYFLYNNSYNTDTIGSCFISTIDNKIYVYPEQQDTLENFKTWLSTHNTIVYYPVATPTYETITDTTLLSQLEALKKSYESVTNISQANNDLPFELSVTALEVMS